MEPKRIIAIRDGNNNEGLTERFQRGFNANQADILAGIDPIDTEKIDYITTKESILPSLLQILVLQILMQLIFQAKVVLR